jgi:hydrogenase expression/formation protein HypE
MQSCGMPTQSSEIIRLGHGSGGKLSEQLIEKIFLPRIGNDVLNQLDDAALVQLNGTKLAFTTDSYVVKPLFFPGGNIGSLSVHGTVNDLCMRFAHPRYLSVSFILEEGFAICDLERIIDSFALAAAESNVKVLAADTKVVNRGAGDGIYINTTGIGTVETDSAPSCNRATPGDAVIVSGDLGRHGMAIMCTREGLELETDLESDSASLVDLVARLHPFTYAINCMRDLTRGGLSSALNEIAHASNVGIELEDSSIPLHPAVRGACELLGLDPLYVACEGRFVTVVNRSDANRVVEELQKHDSGKDARIVGSITEDHKGRVVSTTSVGGKRIVDKLAGDQLPRIC